MGYFILAVLSYVVLAGVSADASLNLEDTNWLNIMLYVKWIGMAFLVDIVIFIMFFLIGAVLYGPRLTSVKSTFIHLRFK